jgi:hypothetical protein
MRRINKRLARRLYDEGKIIHVLPCKASIGSAWFGIGAELNKNDRECTDLYPYNPADFDKRIVYFEVYNCNHELGYYAAYYIKNEDHPDYRKQLIEEGERQQAKASFYED